MYIEADAVFGDSAVGRSFTDPAEFGRFIEGLAQTAIWKGIMVSLRVTVHNHDMHRRDCVCKGAPPLEIIFAGDLR
jgi:hypothetical protein